VTPEAQAAWRAALAARPGTRAFREAELGLQAACGLGKFSASVLTGAASLIGDDSELLARRWRVALQEADREAGTG
jgi:hypothetical protein